MAFTNTQLNYISGTPWSAGFISYVMRNAGVSFPSSPNHTGYAQAIRTDTSATYAFEVLSPTREVPKVGDIIVQNREGNILRFDTPTWSGASHGDIVVSVSGNSVKAIGGNISDSVYTSTYHMTNGKLGPNFFVILRPSSSQSNIVSAAQAEQGAWSSGGWKESDPAAANYLQKYYIAGKLSGIPDYTPETASTTVKSRPPQDPPVQSATSYSELIQKCIEWLSKTEGYSKIAYYDPKNQTKKVSIGYGHQIKPTEKINGIALSNEKIPVKGIEGIDTIITSQQAKDLLAKDLDSVYIPAARTPIGSLWNTLGVNQQVALVSYVYNRGSLTSPNDPNFAKDIISAIQNKDWKAAGQIISIRGVRTAGGSLDDGLVTRRKNEGDMFANNPPQLKDVETKQIPPQPPSEVNKTSPESSYAEQYINQVYKEPFKQQSTGGGDVVYVQAYGGDSVFLIDVTNIGKVALKDVNSIQGDIDLLSTLTQKQTKMQSQISTVVSDRLKDFSPGAKYTLITSRLFEMFPDSMRVKMGINTQDSSPIYAHAWRAPGKLATTADITIPGISGLRIGQVFWVDRISSWFKKYGVFQLFGLTENVDITRGWTTTIHSRFNAIPLQQMTTLYDADIMQSEE